MAPACRRVILKPAGLGERESARLAELLTAALEVQQLLAGKSAHVLQLVGGLQENEHAFFVEHEPAVPFPFVGLFDPTVPGADEKQLLRLTAALFDALRVAHGGEQHRYRVHGGLCPGVLLISPDGIEKVADFGFAPAICTALGVESYLNLAVGPRPDEPPEIRGGGVWEVLSPDEFSRDDRLCAFVDPEKYGTGTLTAFEPRSDVIAAAFILHLLAEHRHPYLYFDPDAHRQLEMSQFMGEGLYNGARRPDLRGSSNPAVKAWCEQVAKTLERVPTDRPTASAVLEALAPHVKPVAAGDILRHRLERAEELAQQGTWSEVRSTLKGLVDSEAAPADVAVRANALLREADARLLLTQAIELFKGPSWLNAGPPLETLLALPALPPAVLEQARKAAGVLDHNRTVWQALEGIETQLGKGESADPSDRSARCQELLTRIAELPPDTTLLPLVRTRRQALREELSNRLERARAERQAAIDADHRQARDWLAHLEIALEQQQWETLQGLLAERPTLQHWPEDAPACVARVQEGFDAHVAEQRRRAAVETDHRRAEEWLTQLRQAADAEQWDGVEELLHDEPKLTYWPETARERARRLAERLQALRKQQTDLEQAHHWFAELRQTVVAGDWEVAADVLARRPTLEDWPQKVLNEEPRYREEITKRLETRALERRRIEEENRRAQAWLERARAAAEGKNWSDTLRILETPPAVDRLPEAVSHEADELKRRCLDALAEKVLQQLDTRTRTVQGLAEDFVRDLVGRTLKPFLDPVNVQSTIDSELFTSPHPSADGRARLSVRVGNPAAPPDEQPIRVAFDFQIKADSPRVCDDDGTFRRALTSELIATLLKLQKARVADLSAPLRQGPFSQAKVEVQLGELAEHAVATVDLLGSGSAEGTITTGVAWIPARLDWEYTDATALARDAANVAAQTTRKVLGPRLLERSQALRRYQSLLGLDVVPPQSWVLGNALALEARLVLRQGAPADRRTLVTFSIIYPLTKEVSFATEVAAAEAELDRRVIDAQTVVRDTLARDLADRIADAPTKVKLIVRPKRIRDPVDQVTFELKGKRREPLVLTAAWDDKTFTYRPTDGWEEALSEVLVPPPVPAPPPTPTPPLAAAPPPAPAPTPVAETHPRRFAKRVAVGVAAAIVLVGVGYLVRELPTRPQVQVSEVAPKSEPQVRPPAMGANDNAAGQLQEVLPINKNSGPVSDSQEQGNTTDGGPAPGNHEAVNANTETTPAKKPEPPSVAESSPAEEPKPLVAAESPPGEVAYNAIKDIKKTLWVRSRSELAQLGDFVDLSQIKVQLISAAEWRLSETQDRWVAEGVAAGIYCTSDTHLPPPWAVLGPIRLPLPIKLEVDVKDGSGRVSPDYQSEELGLLKAELLKRQNSELGKARGALESMLKTVAVKAEVTAPVEFPELVRQVELTVNAAPLRPRTLNTAWDREKLEFAAPDPTDVYALILAYQTLEQLNDRSKAADDWLSQGSLSPVVEISAPAGGMWTLAVAAPWVPSDADVSTLAANDRLLIQVDWLQNPDVTAADLVTQILETKKPEYWPLAEAYHKLAKGDPFFPVTPLRDVAGAGKEVADYLRSDPYIAPELTLKTDPTKHSPQLTQKPPFSLKVDCTGRWGFRLDLGLADGGLPGIDTNGLRSALAQEPMQKPIDLTVTFVLAQGEAQPTVTDDDWARFAALLRKVKALDAQLRRWQDRQKLEKVIEDLLENEKSAAVEPAQAFEFLKRILAVQGAKVPDDLTLQDFFKALGDPGAGGGYYISLFREKNKRRSNISPTIVASYFCGPTRCYALTWSGVGGKLIEGPTVLRLCETRELVRWAITRPQPQDNWGDKLFGAVLDKVRNAIRANPPGGERPFRDQLGVVFALDDALWLAERGQLENLPFKEQESLLPDLGSPKGAPSLRVTWSKLRDLGKCDNPCNYRFVRVLSQPDLGEPTDEELWALGTVYTSLMPTGTPPTP